MQKHHSNFLLLGFSIVLPIILVTIGAVNPLITLTREYPLISAVLGGLLFVSTFTAITGAIVLVTLANNFNPLIVALFGGLGALICNLIMLRVVKTEVTKEFLPLYKKFGNKHFKVLMHSKYFGWITMIIGTLIIASPLPDELGVSLLGISTISTLKFVVLSFTLNTVGITILTLTTTQLLT